MENASKLLKCANCNIVICEVLAFIQNKIDVMDEESLVQVCESAFSLEEVEVAKSLLYKSVSKQPTVRKRKGKTLRNIEDIICLLKETDPEQVPIFVARQLEKLPPITFNHVDVTPLLKKMLVLESAVQRIQSDYVTSKDLNEQLIAYCKNTSVSEMHASQNNVNIRRGGGVSYFDSGPMAISTYHLDECVSHSRKDCNTSPHTNNCSPERVTGACDKLQTPPAQASEGESPVVCELVREFSDKSEPLPGRAATLTPPERQTPCSPACCNTNIMNQDGIHVSNKKIASFSDVVRKDGEWKVPERNEEWILKQKRRLRNQFTSQRGCAVESQSTSQKFRAADIKVPLFISNVAKEVSGQDIIDYVYNKTGEKVSLVKINMRRQKGYDAYKVLVSKHKLDTFLDDKLWPSGITFRLFVNFYDRENNTLNNKEQSKQNS